MLSMLTTSIFAQYDDSEIIDETPAGYAVILSTDSVTNTSEVPAKTKEAFRDRWTVGIKGGATYFHMWVSSPEETKTGIKFGGVSDISHEFSVFTEYLFDYGLGVGAYFGNYSYNRYGLLGSSIEFGAYGHFNLLENAVWTQPVAIARRFHMFWDVGLGVAGMWQNNQIVGHPSSDKVIWRCAAVIRTGLQFEFMIRPHWGILLEGEYHGYGRGTKYFEDQADLFSPWINAAAVSGGLRFYFDTRKKEHDPRLDEDDLPIRKPRNKTPKNAFYINVAVTPEMLEEARRNGGGFTVQATDMSSDSPTVQVVPLKQSHEIESALQILEEQGVGTVLINSIVFVNGQLTDDSMRQLDKVAGSLMSNKLWQKVDLLYMCDQQATTRASIIGTYLRARGVKNLSVKGYDTKTNDGTSDLVITIQ